MDRRERGIHVRGEVDVVEADDADVVGDAQAELADARIAPIAITSLIARTAVGRRPSSQARASPPVRHRCGRPDDQALVRQLDPDRSRTRRDSRATDDP